MKFNEQVGTIFGTIILVIIAITVGVFVWAYEKGQHFDAEIAQVPVFQKKTVKSNSDQAQMKDVLFCGKVYKTNGAVIDGIDVVQRIAEIATAHPEDYVCNNIQTNQTTDTLTAKITKDEKSGDYFLDIHSFFGISGNKIYKVSGLDGTRTYYGNLK